MPYDEYTRRWLTTEATVLSELAPSFNADGNLKEWMQQAFRADITPLTKYKQPQDIPNWHRIALMLMKHGKRIDIYISPDTGRWPVQGWVFANWSKRWFDHLQEWSVWRAIDTSRQLSCNYRRCYDIPATSALGQAILGVWHEQSASANS